MRERNVSSVRPTTGHFRCAALDFATTCMHTFINFFLRCNTIARHLRLPVCVFAHLYVLIDTGHVSLCLHRMQHNLFEKSKRFSVKSYATFAMSPNWIGVCMCVMAFVCVCHRMEVLLHTKHESQWFGQWTPITKSITNANKNAFPPFQSVNKFPKQNHFGSVWYHRCRSLFVGW